MSTETLEGLDGVSVVVPADGDDSLTVRIRLTAFGDARIVLSAADAKHLAARLAFCAAIVDPALGDDLAIPFTTITGRLRDLLVDVGAAQDYAAEDLPEPRPAPGWEPTRAAEPPAVDAPPQPDPEPAPGPETALQPVSHGISGPKLNDLYPGPPAVGPEPPASGSSTVDDGGETGSGNGGGVFSLGDVDLSETREADVESNTDREFADRVHAALDERDVAAAEACVSVRRTVAEDRTVSHVGPRSPVERIEDCDIDPESCSTANRYAYGCRKDGCSIASRLKGRGAIANREKVTAETVAAEIARQPIKRTAARARRVDPAVAPPASADPGPEPPVGSHRLAHETRLGTAGYRAWCECGAEFDGTDKVEARSKLSDHIDEVAA